MDKSFEIIQTNHGNFLINEYDLIGSYIKHVGNWEIYLYDFYSKVLDKDDICVDAGANLGYHSIQFGFLSKKVYAFEPQSLVFNQLCANILFNGLDNIILPHKLALGDKKSTQQMWDIENEGWCGNGMYNWGGRGIEHKDSSFTSDRIREHDQIEVIPLDSLNIPKCDLFKIDIQGYEYYAFLGAKDLIQKHKPIILLENGTTDMDKLTLEFLKNIGYENYRFHCTDTNEDCVLIHPLNKKYNLSLEKLKEIENKYNIKKEF
jgi:FkbM family methyltransferase